MSLGLELLSDSYKTLGLEAPRIHRKPFDIGPKVLVEEYSSEMALFQAFHIRILLVESCKAAPRNTALPSNSQGLEAFYPKKC